MLYLALLLSYLCGSIPFGVIIGKLYGVDVRAVGSGNIGATNVWRTLGRVPGASVFILDVLKGFSGAWLGRLLVGSDANHSTAIALCALMAVLGHMCSIFLGFKGGKGIATGLGVALGLAPIPALATFALWSVMVLITRMISAGSIVACLVAPIAYWLTGAPVPYLVIMTLIAIVAILKHIPNIKRIMAGTEPKLNSPKQDQNANNTASVKPTAGEKPTIEPMATERISRVETRGETATGP